MLPCYSFKILKTVSGKKSIGINSKVFTSYVFNYNRMIFKNKFEMH
jgi:hypothetical protein